MLRSPDSSVAPFPQRTTSQWSNVTCFVGRGRAIPLLRLRTSPSQTPERSSVICFRIPTGDCSERTSLCNGTSPPSTLPSGPPRSEARTGEPGTTSRSRVVWHGPPSRRRRVSMPRFFALRVVRSRSWLLRSTRRTGGFYRMRSVHRFRLGDLCALISRRSRSSAWHRLSALRRKHVRGISTRGNGRRSSVLLVDPGHLRDLGLDQDRGERGQPTALMTGRCEHA